MNKLKNAWRNRTLREKLIFSSVVCVLLPLVLSFAMMIRLVQDELVHQLTGRHRATMLISVHETDIRELLDNIRVDSRQEVMLVDGSGTVVSHNNQKMTRKSFPFHELLMTDHTTHHVVDYNGKPYVMVHQLFSFGDWRIVSLIPRQTAIGNIPMIMRNTLVTLLVCFFVFLLLLIGLVSLLTKPLNRLNRVIEQVKNGNLHVRSGLAGRGDIEQLGQSMDTMMDTVNNMIEKIKIAEKSKRKAELEMLQAQINPHFLFNTLNSLRLKISMSGDQDSSNIIRSLSMLLRMTFQRDNEFVPLSKEIEVVRHYLQLMNFKSNSSIDLEENVDPATLDVKVPCFFLQPLIENSILHGFQHKSGKITICSRSQQDGVIVTVSDNGKGLSPDVLKQLQNKLRTVNMEVPVHRNKSSFTGIGLGNVYQRMKLIYGHRFRMEIGSVPSGGTQIVFFIPAQHEV